MYVIKLHFFRIKTSKGLSEKLYSTANPQIVTTNYNTRKTIGYSFI